MCICFDFFGAIGLWLHYNINMSPSALYIFFALNLGKTFCKIVGHIYVVIGLIHDWGSQKMKKDSKTFVGLQFANNIHLKQI
jgi:hypothetical protein